MSVTVLMVSWKTDIPTHSTWVCNKQEAYTNFEKAITDGVARNLLRNDQYLGPVRDQGDTGQCSAYAASDMLEVWLKSKGRLPIDQYLSGLGLGLNHHSTRWRRRAAQYQRWSEQRKYLLRAVEENPERADALEAQIESIRALEYDSVPEGGQVGPVIELAYKRDILCLESEVSSEGRVIRDLYRNHTRESGDECHLPNETFNPSMQLSLARLASSPFEEQTEEKCRAYYMARSIFRNSSLSFNDFHDLAQSSKGGDIFDKLLKISCTPKNFGLPPRIGVSYASVDPDNHLFDVIDKTLEQGNLAVVFYHSIMLRGKGGRSHESTIVGSVNICGQKHYILRNSWGSTMCQYHRNDFFNFTDEILDMNPRKEQCLSETKEKLQNERHYCNRMARTERRNRCKAQAQSTYLYQMGLCQRHSRASGKPYGCDTEGNFIISREHLGKQLSRVYHIAEE